MLDAWLQALGVELKDGPAVDAAIRYATKARLREAKPDGEGGDE